MTDVEEMRSEEKDTSDQIASESEDGLESIVESGAEKVKQWTNELGLSESTTAAVIGTVLGCAAVRGMTKAWPRLETPVKIAGYLVAGLAVYSVVKRSFKNRADSRSKSLTEEETHQTPVRLELR